MTSDKDKESTKCRRCLDRPVPAGGDLCDKCRSDDDRQSQTATQTATQAAALVAMTCF